MDTNSFINQVKSYRKSTLNKALQVNSFANGGPTDQIPPYITSDPADYYKRKQAYADSLANYNAAVEFDRIKRLPPDSQEKYEAVRQYADKYFDRIGYSDVDRYPTEKIKGKIEGASVDNKYYGYYTPKKGVETSDEYISGWSGWNRTSYDIAHAGSRTLKPRQQVIYQDKPKTYNYEVSREVQYPNTQSARIWRILTNNNEYNLNPNEEDYPVDPRYKGINDTVTEAERNAWNRRFNIEPYTKEMTEEEANKLEKQGYTVRKYDFGGELYGHDPLEKIVKHSLRKAYKKANKEGFKGRFRDAWKNRDYYELYDDELALGGPTTSNQSNYLSSKIDSVIAANKPFTIAEPINNKLLSYTYKELTPIDGQGTSENPFLLEPVTIYPQKDQTVRYIQYNNSNDSDFANKQKYYTTYTDYDIDKLETYEKFEPTAGFSPIDFFLTNIFGNNAIGEQNERWKSYLHLNNNLPVKNGYYLTTPREKETIRQYIDTASLKDIYDNYDYYNDKYNLELSKDDVGEMLDKSRQIMDNPNKTFSVNGDISLIKNSTADGTNETTSPLGGLRNFDITWDNKNNKIIVNDKYDFTKAAHFFGVPDLDNTAPIIKDTIDYNPQKGSNLIYYLKNRDSLPKSIHSGHEIQKSLLDL